MDKIRKLLIELDQLKLIYRRSYISDGSRNENSAEHSWHLAIALLAFEEMLPDGFRLEHALRLALMHDICEIGAGDVSVYDAARVHQPLAEMIYMRQFAENFGHFGAEAAALWQEYEEQNTVESVWVKVLDRLLPFLLNIASDGKNWREQGISKSQVLAVNQIIIEQSPELGQWIIAEIENAVQNGWLLSK